MVDETSDRPAPEDAEQGALEAHGVVATLRRPGAFRRLLAGAWHVPSGFCFLMRHPRLWPVALAPSLLSTALLLGGMLLGIYLINPLLGTLVPARHRAPDWLGLSMTMTMCLTAVLIGLVLGLAIALLLTGALLDRLALRMEAPHAPGSTRRLLRPRALAQALRDGLGLLKVAPFVFLLGVLPLVGPLAAALLTGWTLASQQTQPILARQGLDRAGRRRWRRLWRAECLGFGLTGVGVLLIPPLNFLLTSALTVGAKLLVIELEELSPVASRGAGSPMTVPSSEPSATSPQAPS